MLAAPIRALEIIQAENKPTRADRQVSSTRWLPRINSRTGVDLVAFGSCCISPFDVMTALKFSAALSTCNRAMKAAR